MNNAELRKNNLLTYKGKEYFVMGISSQSVRLFDGKGEDIWVFEDEVEPIPLTEEMLVRLGFKKSKGKNLKEFILGDFIIYTYPETGIELYYGVGFYIKIQYVHQLQNLYFTLTGTELTLKPNN